MYSHLELKLSGFMPPAATKLMDRPELYRALVAHSNKRVFELEDTKGRQGFQRLRREANINIHEGLRGFPTV